MIDETQRSSHNKIKVNDYREDLPSVNDLGDIPDLDKLKAARFAYGSIFTEYIPNFLPTKHLTYYDIDSESVIDTIPSTELGDLNPDQFLTALENTVNYAVHTASNSLKESNTDFLDNYDEFIALENKRREGKATIYRDGHKTLIRSATKSAVFAVITGLSILEKKGLSIEEIDEILSNPTTYNSLTNFVNMHIDIFSEIDHVLKTPTQGRHWAHHPFNFEDERILVNFAGVKMLKQAVAGNITPDTITLTCAAGYANVPVNGNQEETTNGIRHIYDWAKDWSIAWKRARGH